MTSEKNLDRGSNSS